MRVMMTRDFRFRYRSDNNFDYYFVLEKQFQSHLTQNNFRFRYTYS